uniref:TROVE domain-containing protein n=1 Tax=Parascaris univalens TaxID=6257 RepID=A0A915BAM9_PARUN
MSVCVTIAWIATCVRKKADPSSPPPTGLTLNLPPIISLPENPAFPFADSTRGSETDVEPIITGGDLSPKVPSQLQGNSPKSLPIIEVNSNAIAEDKKDDLKTACVFIVKPSKGTFTEGKKEKVKKSLRERKTDKTQSSDAPLQGTHQITVATVRSIPVRSERKPIGRMSKLGLVKNKSARIVKNTFRMGTKDGSQSAADFIKSKGLSSSDSQQLITAKAVKAIKRNEEQTVNIEPLSANFEAIQVESGGFVITKNDDKNEPMMEKTAEAIVRDDADPTQSPIITPERTQSTKIMKE